MKKDVIAAIQAELKEYERQKNSDKTEDIASNENSKTTSDNTVSYAEELFKPAVTPKESVMLPIDSIEPNGNNFYHITDIDSLKDSIRTTGLQQPLIVHPKENGKYSLVGGERRYSAINALREEGAWEGDTVPCVILDYDKVDLPLSDEDKELFCLITTNREQRKYSDWETLKEIEKLRELYAKLKLAHATHYPIGMGENDRNTIQPLRGRTRDFISEAIGMSKSAVGKYDKITKHGTEELRDAIRENRISASVASVASDLPPEMQRELVASKDFINLSDVRAMLKDDNEDTARDSESGENENLISVPSRELSVKLKKCSQGLSGHPLLELSKHNYLALQNAIDTIFNILDL